MDAKLINNKEASKYEYPLGTCTARVDYDRVQQGVLDLTTVYVPKEMEGQGIATNMLKLVLEDIEKQGLKIIPTCPFVTGFIKRYPEWEGLVYKE